ncbi:hypothetical protein QVD17_11153 [Tagetes erecta]|uniref:G protein gamma domain-containing protein n=1 Tax=Tagetes erecta TaxID=13708 RepID=A0AAD8L2H6_TARER|nr:hypothetical protein QVD17_11153 [Tagetes erecta]
MSPPSPILYADLYGKRRHVAKVQVLEREIGLLQDEIKSLADLEPALKSCKELHDYVEATPDPLVAMYDFSFTSFHHGLFFIKIHGHVNTFTNNTCLCCGTEIKHQVKAETSGKIFGEKLAGCYGVVAVATQKSAAHAFHAQKTLAGVVKRKHVPQHVAHVLHATAATIQLA